eukprot:6847739-Prymnesium_polylepis.1
MPGLTAIGSGRRLDLELTDRRADALRRMELELDVEPWLATWQQLATAAGNSWQPTGNRLATWRPGNHWQPLATCGCQSRGS